MYISFSLGKCGKYRTSRSSWVSCVWPPFYPSWCHMTSCSSISIHSGFSVEVGLLNPVGIVSIENRIRHLGAELYAVQRIVAYKLKHYANLYSDMRFFKLKLTICRLFSLWFDHSDQMVCQDGTEQESKSSKHNLDSSMCNLDILILD